jgi:hypothetical protein
MAAHPPPTPGASRFHCLDQEAVSLILQRLLPPGGALGDADDAGDRGDGACWPSAAEADAADHARRAALAPMRAARLAAPAFALAARERMATRVALTEANTAGGRRPVWARFPALRALVIAGWPQNMDAAAVAADATFEPLLRVTSLTLGETSGSGAATLMRALDLVAPRLPALRRLSGLLDAGGSAGGDLPSLAKAIAGATALETIDLPSVVACDALAKALAELPALTCLRLGSPGSVAAVALLPCERLAALSLQARLGTAAGRFSRLTRLEGALLSPDKAGELAVGAPLLRVLDCTIEGEFVDGYQFDPPTALRPPPFASVVEATMRFDGAVGIGYVLLSELLPAVERLAMCPARGPRDQVTEWPCLLGLTRLRALRYSGAYMFCEGDSATAMRSMRHLTALASAADVRHTDERKSILGIAAQLEVMELELKACPADTCRAPLDVAAFLADVAAAAPRLRELKVFCLEGHGHDYGSVAVDWSDAALRDFAARSPPCLERLHVSGGLRVPPHALAALGVHPSLQTVSVRLPNGPERDAALEIAAQAQAGAGPAIRVLGPCDEVHHLTWAEGRPLAFAGPAAP